MSWWLLVLVPVISHQDRKTGFYSGKDVLVAKNSSNDLRKFLATLDTGVDPDLHINGPHFGAAVVVIDFGTPLKPVKLTGEQAQELTARLRKLTLELSGNRHVNIRVNNDYQNGIYWSSIN